MVPARLLWVFLLLSAAVTACVPERVTYLRPSAPGAEYTRSVCGEAVGPKDRAVLRGPEGYVIRVDSYSLEELSLIQREDKQIAIKQGRRARESSHDYQTGIGLTIIVQPPRNQSASMRFLSKSFFLADEETRSVYEYQVEHVLDFEDALVNLDGIVAALKSLRSGDDRAKVRRLNVLEALTPIPPETKWFRTIYRPYYIVLFFENVRSKQFRLRIPQVSVGETTFDFPEISFRLVDEWIVVPLNC